MKPLQYKFYATILDGFQGYLSSSEMFQQYWGFSENTEKTEESFEKEQFQSLIDRINRVPFSSEAADRGTVFNEVIDCLIENRKPEKDMVFVSDRTKNIILAKYKEYTFEYPLDICKQFAEYFNDAICQYQVSAILPTKYGNVEVYGYIDELKPDKVCDIKTTKQYHAFKFKQNWQHIVYPYCLLQNGNFIYDFEYNVTDFKNIFKECYTFNPETDIQRLTLHCEAFIEFLEANKELITDKKIFANE
jgi:hypothetical protein